MDRFPEAAQNQILAKQTGLAKGNKKKIWDKYCGYLDLDIDSYMQIQNRLLLEQIAIIKDCNLGKHFFGKKAPASVNEFRKKTFIRIGVDPGGGGAHI